MKKIMNIIDEENNSGKYEIFCTFDSELTNKSYVIYTGHYEDEDGSLIMRAGSYIESAEGLKVNKNLTHIENEMISNVMKNILDQAQKIDL